VVHTAKFHLKIALCFTATPAQAAGFRLIDVPAGRRWACSEPPSEIELGNIAVPG
jgi:hypothetical protein